MPSYKIREISQELSTQIAATTNAVYIPGYAVMGPINEPVECSSLEEFTAVFGTVPYTFKAAQAAPVFDPEVTGNLYSAGEYEKSYIYARELLAQGIPVVYERVFNATNKATWTATADVPASVAETKIMTLTAVEVGAVGTAIAYSVESVGSGTHQFKLKVRREKNLSVGATEVEVAVTRFATTASAATGGYVLLSDLVGKVDVSGLVKIGAGDSGAEATNVTETKLSVLGTGDEFTVAYMYTAFGDAPTSLFSKLADRGDYIIKFITSGAYPTFEYEGSGTTNAVAKKMISVAASRGDCTAVIDHYNNTSRDLVNSESVFSAVDSFVDATVNTLGESIFDYAAMYSPYATYSTAFGDTVLPGSFGFLHATAVSARTNNNWQAVAGSIRGVLPNLLSLQQNVTNAVADAWVTREGVCINPITRIRPYGYVIWGTQTMHRNNNEFVFKSFMNIRQLLNDIKRVVFTSCRRYTFEQNSDILWVNFKSLITPTLDSMKSGEGIRDYSIDKVEGAARGEVKAVISISPIEPVEDWDITINLKDGTVTVNA